MSFAPVSEARGARLELDLSECQSIGLKGEEIAATHLRRLGWEILEKRYRCPQGEIDVIARQGATLVFLEVKTLRTRGKHPAGAVDKRKRSRLAAAAEHYLACRHIGECSCRFDVAEVEMLPDGTGRVQLITNAFMAGE
ncbi:MAG: YraN family protein [Chthonomonadales bacterium]